MALALSLINLSLGPAISIYIYIYILIINNCQGLYYRGLTQAVFLHLRLRHATLNISKNNLWQNSAVCLMLPHSQFQEYHVVQQRRYNCLEFIYLLLHMHSHQRKRCICLEKVRNGSENRSSLLLCCFSLKEIYCFYKVLAAACFSKVVNGLDKFLK